MLLTSSETGPTGVSAGSATATGMIMLLHLNADGRSGGVVSIPPQAVVAVPGHGTTAIENATVYGGPSLLVRTVHQLTGVPIDHFARVDFSHLADLINAVEGSMSRYRRPPQASATRSPRGSTILGGVTALYYARDPSISEQNRVLRQQNLLRAAINKVVHTHLLSNPLTTINILNALTSALTVDSNFSNGELISLASSLRNVTSNNGTFVTAPTTVANGQEVLNSAISDQLWSAIDNDSLAAFAGQHPSTVTPTTVP